MKKMAPLAILDTCAAAARAIIAFCSKYATWCQNMDDFGADNHVQHCQYLWE